jgi:hypothetical protein
MATDAEKEKLTAAFFCHATWGMRINTGPALKLQQNAPGLGCHHRNIDRIWGYQPKTGPGQSVAMALLHLSIFIVAPMIVVRLVERLNEDRDAFTHDEQVHILEGDCANRSAAGSD